MLFKKKKKKSSGGGGGVVKGLEITMFIGVYCNIFVVGYFKILFRCTDQHGMVVKYYYENVGR